jgi:hypothetical protein
MCRARWAIWCEGITPESPGVLRRKATYGYYEVRRCACHPIWETMYSVTWLTGWFRVAVRSSSVHLTFGPPSYLLATFGFNCGGRTMRARELSDRLAVLQQQRSAIDGLISAIRLFLSKKTTGRPRVGSLSFRTVPRRRRNDCPRFR